LGLGRLSADRFDAIDAAIEVEMEVAIEFAKASPNPDPARLTEDVYA